MTAVPLASDRLPDGIEARGTCRIVDHVVGLAEIFDTDVNAVVLRAPRIHRAPAVDLDRLIADLRHPLRVDVRADGDAEPELDRTLERPGCGPALPAAIRHWTTVLSDLTGATGCGIRLARLDEQMCPLFHADRVTARLLVTWRGVTTELVTTPGYAERIADDEAARRSGAGADVFRPAPGDLVLMKGALWPDCSAGPAVHRSPAVPAGEPRIVCTWDPVV